MVLKKLKVLQMFLGCVGLDSKESDFPSQKLITASFQISNSLGTDLALKRSLIVEKKERFENRST